MYLTKTKIKQLYAKQVWSIYVKEMFWVPKGREKAKNHSHKGQGILPNLKANAEIPKTTYASQDMTLNWIP